MSVTPLFPVHSRPLQIVFDRQELAQILNLYGRMVAAGHWRDYAISMDSDTATFSAFRRASEKPDCQLFKCPALRNKQGQYGLLGEHGVMLKRGNDLKSVLAPLERRLLKLIERD